MDKFFNVFESASDCGRIAEVWNHIPSVNAGCRYGKVLAVKNCYPDAYSETLRPELYDFKKIYLVENGEFFDVIIAIEKSQEEQEKIFAMYENY